MVQEILTEAEGNRHEHDGDHPGKGAAAFAPDDLEGGEASITTRLTR